MQPIQPTIVGVCFQKGGKIYHFAAGNVTDLHTGDYVVVETSRGIQLGQVTHFVAEPTPPPEGVWKLIQRRASQRDLVERQTWQDKETAATISCREKVSELKLADMKIVSAEYSLDGTRLTFMYCSEAGDKLDLRGLRKGLSRQYPHTQVDLHQVGPRDVAKYLGGMGACGLECRCCTAFLTDFSPISIKMAKDQGISLTPTEITGMCGRLRCCLVYEYEQYAEARKHLPKKGKVVMTPLGEAKVLEVLALKNSILVELPTGARHEFTADDLRPKEELDALVQKAGAPSPVNLEPSESQISFEPSVETEAQKPAPSAKPAPFVKSAPHTKPGQHGKPGPQGKPAPSTNKPDRPARKGKKK